MADIIQLLPDHIANQIAAGEVIQRPASVVKELLENAIDAESTEIKLIVKDAGKTLIQVIDNGKGMSVTDARMCFERHATSKIKSADELFAIKTKGFRGEALASIGAIAHVELITRTAQEELATRIYMEGSKITKQEFVQAAAGTQFSIKNLFFNVPARRKFLKSEPVEFKHILDEFHRVALAHPEISLSLHHNGNEIYRLTKGNLKQRIIAIFGKNLDEKLLTVQEQVDIIHIRGFIGKVEIAKKSPGDQYIFVNNRYIKSSYLNHAIKAAYDQLLQPDQYPSYFIYLDIDPAQIDINVHPTKTEIKFEEERLIYNYLRGAVKHALGKYLVVPTLDFETDTNFGARVPQPSAIRREASNMPQAGTSYQSHASQLERENLKNWENIYSGLKTNPTGDTQPMIKQTSLDFQEDDPHRHGSTKDPYQIHQSYIMSTILSGFILIDQQYAHERILYEDTLHSISGHPRPIQKELFPFTLDLQPAKADALRNLLSKINALGFEIEEFGQHTFILHGTPMGLTKNTSPVQLIENLIDQYLDQQELQLGIDENLARSWASTACIKRGKNLSVEEMKALIDQLFACETPFISPFGKKCFLTFDMEDLKKKF